MRTALVMEASDIMLFHLGLPWGQSAIASRGREAADGLLGFIKVTALSMAALSLCIPLTAAAAEPSTSKQDGGRIAASDGLGISWQDVILHEEEMAEELGDEYVKVNFQPAKDFQHRGVCPLHPDAAEVLEPGDVMVIVDEVCQGFVGEMLMLSPGNFEFSVDVLGAQTVEANVRSTTPTYPRIITVRVVSNE